MYDDIPRKKITTLSSTNFSTNLVTSRSSHILQITELCCYWLSSDMKVKGITMLMYIFVIKTSKNHSNSQNISTALQSKLQAVHSFVEKMCT